MVRSSLSYEIVAHVRRHEDLYTEMEERVIRSDDLNQGNNGGALSAERMFLDCKVVLCTLSMLSNPVLEQCKVYRLITMERLIIDEASQINVGELMVRSFVVQLQRRTRSWPRQHLLHKFRDLK